MKKRLACLLVVVLGLGGCGLPGHTDPAFVGAATNSNPAQDVTEDLPSPKGITTPSALVSMFLQSSAYGNVTGGDQPDGLQQTQDRMRTFLTPGLRTAWKAGKSVTVVRAIQTSQEPLPGGGGWAVTDHLVQIGTLSPFGEIQHQPVSGSGLESDFTFDVVTSATGELLLSTAPPGTLLSVDGLQAWYGEQPIYFWESGVDIPKLVPDLRYMPKSLRSGEAKRVAEVVRWLRDGPSALLQTVVLPLRPEIDMKGVPTVGGDGVTINLSVKAASLLEPDLRRLASQLWWSLSPSPGPNHPKVTLTIEGKDTQTSIQSDNFDNDNVAAAQVETDPPQFGIDAGAARRIDVAAADPPLFAPGGDNSQVLSAAIDRAESHAALVRVSGKNQQLWVNAASGAVKYVPVPGVIGPRLSQPAWISRPTPLFLVADGTQLLAVRPPTTADPNPGVEEVAAAAGPLTGLTAFSVAPDGRRIALIIKGRVRVAPLRIEGGLLSVGDSYEILTSLGDNEAVGWITETALVVGGRKSPALPAAATYSLVSVNVDGTGEMALPHRAPSATAAVTINQLAARTNDPLASIGANLIMFEANQVAYELYLVEIRQIPRIVPVPAQSAPPGGAGQALTTPFYAG